MKPGEAEVNVVEDCEALSAKKKRPAENLFFPMVNQRHEFAGNYENQIRSQKTLMVVLPLASVHHLHHPLLSSFKSVITTSLVFTGIAIAWAGGFYHACGSMLSRGFWTSAYSARDMQSLFQIHTDQFERRRLGWLPGIVRNCDRRRCGDYDLSGPEFFPTTDHERAPKPVPQPLPLAFAVCVPA